MYRIHLNLRLIVKMTLFNIDLYLKCAQLYDGSFFMRHLNLLTFLQLNNGASPALVDKFILIKFKH